MNRLYTDKEIIKELIKEIIDLEKENLKTKNANNEQMTEEIKKIISNKIKKIREEEV